MKKDSKKRVYDSQLYGWILAHRETLYALWKNPLLLKSVKLQIKALDGKG